MDEDQGSRPGPIEGLPVELVRMVLSALPDVQSLQVTASSCPLFYNAFSEAETSITARVLLNQVDVSVLPEAIAASDSSSLCPHDTDPQSRKAIMDFVARNLRQRPTLPKSWFLKEALRLGRFHSCVEQLARQFADAALTNGPTAHSQSGATYQEECRIQRALYRFEIYRNLFRDTPKAESIIYGEQNQLFFANFAPWENEQLGCIHDFLVRAVSPAFNDVVEHDIHWGVVGVEYGDSIDAPFIQNVLCLGLEKLHEITRTETYADRERIFCCSGYSPLPTDSFLHEGFLYHANKQGYDVYLNSLTPEDEVLYIGQPFFADPDSGPTDIWRWAHYEESQHYWVYQDDRRNLRKWGYVMWDRLRLEAIGIFQEPWVDTDDDNSIESILEEQEIQRQRMYLKNSQDQREIVSRRGGSGWWSWGDESKVIWKDRKSSASPPPARRYAPAHVKPHSLEAARELLSMMKLPSRIPSCGIR